MSSTETVLTELELSRSLTVQWLVVGTLGFAVAFGALHALFQGVVGHPPSFDFAPAGAGWWVEPFDLLVVLVLATAIVLPHEWLHGLAIRYYGGEPRYGVGVAHFVLPYAYATTDHRFTRGQFVVVLPVPLVAMTAVGVPLMLALGWGWLALPLAANAGGAVGDLWMTLTLLSYPSHVEVEDCATGVRIFGREGDRPRDLAPSTAVWDALVGAAVGSVGFLLLLSAGGLFVLDALGVDSFTVGRPGTPTFLVSYVNTETTISLEVGFGLPLLGAFVGLAYSFLRSYRRGRGRTAAD